MAGENDLKVANADLRDISTWARLSGPQLRQPLLALMTDDATDEGSSSLTSVVDVNASMESLVRLLSASKELDSITLQAVEALSMSAFSRSPCSEGGADEARILRPTGSAVEALPKEPPLNAGLVDPLFTVIMEDHASSGAVLKLVCAMAPRTVMKVSLLSNLSLPFSDP